MCVLGRVLGRGDEAEKVYREENVVVMVVVIVEKKEDGWTGWW